MSDRSYYDQDGIKASIAQILTKYNLTRPQMLSCLELALDLDIDKLLQIYERLSKNQKSKNYGKAIKELISFKQEHHL